LINGWQHTNTKFPGQKFLTTTQGVELALKDLITFCVDPNLEPKEPYKAVGCNVTVLKHANSNYQLKMNQLMIPQSLAEIDLGKNKKTVKAKRSRKKSQMSMGNDSSSDSKTKSLMETKPKPVPYYEFLLKSDVVDQEEYDSDVDPPYMPLPFDLELDYDEYSDGEIPEEEEQGLIKEASEELEVEELIRKMEEAELQAKKLADEPDNENKTDEKGDETTKEIKDSVVEPHNKKELYCSKGDCSSSSDTIVNEEINKPKEIAENATVVTSTVS